MCDPGAQGSSGQAVNLGVCTKGALTPPNMEETTLKILRNKGKWPRAAPGVGSVPRSPRGNMWAKDTPEMRPQPHACRRCCSLALVPCPVARHPWAARPPRLCSALRWSRCPTLQAGVSALHTVVLSSLICLSSATSDPPHPFLLHATVPPQVSPALEQLPRNFHPIPAS